MTNHTKAFIALSVAVVVTYLSVRFLLPLVTPFVMAVFLAILIDPVVSFAHRKLRMPRGLAVFLALIVVSGLLITALSLSVAEIAHEIDQLSRNVGGLSAAITKGHREPVLPGGALRGGPATAHRELHQRAAEDHRDLP